MSDLILRIDFDESKKNNNITLRVFQGKIPKLKSNQFSGQLRQVDINSHLKFDNLSSEKLMRLKNFLNHPQNKKVGRNTYIIFGKNIFNFDWIKDYDCLFYKNKDKQMYKIIEYSSLIYKDIEYNREKNYMYYYDKTYLNICDITPDKINNENNLQTEIIPMFYIDLSGKEATGFLEFDYNGYTINYKSKNIFLEKIDEFRNYEYEEKIVKIIKDNYWHLKKNGNFIYSGENLYNSIDKIINNNIKVYNKAGKKINTAKMENINISYDMDWFNVSGDFYIDEVRYKFDDIISAINNKDKWIEIDDINVILKQNELEILKKIKRKDNKTGFSKENLIDVINISEEKKINISNIEKLYSYNNVATVPKKIWNILRSYQREGVKWLNSRCNSGFGVCLADDMGLGKTLQTIAFLSQKNWSDELNIVIAPMTLLENWKREIIKYSPNLKVKIYHGKNRDIEDVNNGSTNIILTTYGTCLNDIDKLKKIKFGCLVVDEAQYIKNKKSKTYKAIRNIKSKFRILLTGTPMENNLEEYWSLMQILNYNYLPSYSTIRRLVNYDENKLINLVKKTTSPFILRRMKKEVLNELPKKIEQVIYCDFEESQYNLYMNIKNDIRKYLMSENQEHVIKDSATYVLEGLLRLRQVCCDPRILPRKLNKQRIFDSGKTILVLDMISELIYNNHKIVLYSDFPPMLKILQKKLEKKNIKTFYIDGKVKSRQRIVDEFENSETGIFLISLKAGGTGLNLVSSDTVIIYNPWWNPAAEKQAEDRIYRIGQRKNVTIYRLIMTNSIEEKMMELKNIKMDVSTQLLNDAHGINNLTIEEIKKIILS